MNTNIQGPKAGKTDEKLVFDAQLLADGTSIHRVDGLCSLYRNLNKELRKMSSENPRHAQYEDLSRRTETQLRTFIQQQRIKKARHFHSRYLELQSLGSL